MGLLPLKMHGVAIGEMPETYLIYVVPEAIQLDILSPKNLNNAPLLLISGSSKMRKRLMKAFNDSGSTANVIVNSTFTGPICCLVAIAMGISIMDMLTAHPYSGPQIETHPFAPSIPCKLKLDLRLEHAQ